MKRAFVCLLLIGAVVGFASCKTTGKTDKDGMTVAFQPAGPLAQLHVDKASYNSLFSARSYALWVGPEVTRQRRDEALNTGETVLAEADAAAPEIDENFLVLECHIESVFEDMSIGYDVVGFRGIQVYLEAPDGSKIPPAQVIMGSQLEEKPQGALKIFRRTNLVVFPRKTLNLTASLSREKKPAARLVLEGYNSKFYFEWRSDVPGQESSPLISPEFRQAAKMRYTEYYTKMRELGHRFD